MQSEATPPEEAFNPTVKRSGWHPPSDTGLWKPAEAMRARVWESLGAQQVAFLKAEMAFFDAVTDVSGKLYPVPKYNRRIKAAEFLAVGHPAQNALVYFMPMHLRDLVNHLSA